MGKYKEYISDLADRLGKEFDQVTPNDVEFDFMNKAQSIWADSKSHPYLKEDNKVFLPKVSITLLKDGVYKIGDVFVQKNTLTGQEYYYLVTE
jgi:hypothetical protein